MTTKNISVSFLTALQRITEAAVTLTKTFSGRRQPDRFDLLRVVDDLAVAITKLGPDAVPRALAILQEETPQTSVIVGNNGTTFTLSTADLRSLVRVVRSTASLTPGDTNRVHILIDWVNENVLTNAQG